MIHINYTTLTRFILNDESTLCLRGIRYEMQGHAATRRHRCKDRQIVRVARQGCQLCIIYGCSIFDIQKVVTEMKKLHSYCSFYIRYLIHRIFIPKLSKNHQKGFCLPCLDVKKRKANFYTVQRGCF